MEKWATNRFTTEIEELTGRKAFEKVVFESFVLFGYLGDSNMTLDIIKEHNSLDTST